MLYLWDGELPKFVVLLNQPQLLLLLFSVFMLFHSVKLPIFLFLGILHRHFTNITELIFAEFVYQLTYQKL